MKKKYIVTWDNLHFFTRKLVKKIIYTRNWEKIIAVSRGGLVSASIISRELNIRYVDTLCISSYEVTDFKKTKILKNSSFLGKNVLIVDDLVDTGSTARFIRNMYPDAYFVTIFAKPMGKIFVDKYVVDISQDTWIEQPWDMHWSYIKPIKNLNIN
ncbi:xanthine phosphoribosyltransferase [Buchnera aphidicola (Mollitrichosiphum nigrofasciatum)]|uniref:xanthine phosphoribosyltransferase n=1 Tax=Buchnera aphidicola TaxID=9 RepID=UPI0031B82C94